MLLQTVRPTSTSRRRGLVTIGVALTTVVAVTLASAAVAGAGPLPLPTPAAQPPAGSAEGAVTYEPPVAAPVLDPFRAPANPYGPGNRGIEYDTWPGQPVLAAAHGSVAFAGSVAGALHVTVRHAAGVRTSYSFLASIAVAVGQRVDQGTMVGRAGETFHFGARIGSAYIDPAALFGSGPTEAVLVPHERPWSASTAQQGSSVARAGGDARVPMRVGSWSPRRLSHGRVSPS
jgi:murein DD-endopeptidase MepM/ murein hydrolase activator NlpD